MIAVIHNVCIRGREPKVNSKGDPYLLVRFEDETGKPYELVDKNMEREEYYTRGSEGDLHISIDQGKYTTIRIVNYKQR